MSDETEAKPGQGLTYPVGAIPVPGEAIEIAPGVLWLRLPMPGRLDHINVWLLKDAGGWTLVDSGLPNESTRELWRTLFTTVLKGEPITRVLITHLHPDHIGSAGWIVEYFDTMLWMTRTDYLLCRALVMDTGREAPYEALRFFKGAGANEAQLNRYRERFGQFGADIFRLPQAYRRIVDRETLRIGAQDWTVIVGRGHAPEHACLWCPALKLLISGDQILPRISSNVSVHPTEPSANPLEEWLTSCQMLKELIPDDTLVLPAHNEPFVGARARLDELIGGHEKGMAALVELCRTPKRAVDCFEPLFRSKITDATVMMATTESVAHLNCLLERGKLTRSTDAQGVIWYKTAA